MNDTIRMRLTAVVEYDAQPGNYEPNAEGHVTAREIAQTDIENAGDILSDAALYGGWATTYTLKAADAEPDFEDIISTAREMAQYGVKIDDLLDWVLEQLCPGVQV